MNFERNSKVEQMNSFSSYLSTSVEECEKLLSYIDNRTIFFNQQQSTPLYIRQLLTRRNSTFRLPLTMDECANELQRLTVNGDDKHSIGQHVDDVYDLHEYSTSLIIFVVLIGLVSIISIVGNLCLAKVLYAKRHRLLQTDRIVLCLALSELCLVLIDSPTEIYRFLSYSFSQAWLCRFHTFFESLFSSCIIFYHLLGAFDRFVYIHGQTISISTWSKWCRRVSTKSGSIILLILPILLSLPIAICNVLHSHIFLTSPKMKTCIVQYKHAALISFLIIVYILPILLSFFLHSKLIYFILSKHRQHYSVVMKANQLSTKRLTIETQLTSHKKQTQRKPSTTNQKLMKDRLINLESSNGHLNIAKTGDTSNIHGVLATPLSTREQSQATKMMKKNNNNNNQNSNTYGASRSSAAQLLMSTTSPVTYYKSTSQANANANRTVLLLVLLLSSYVLCWFPYNVYSWRHSYQSTSTEGNLTDINRTERNLFNESSSSFVFDQIHSNLRRIIYINYALYLLSMLSMCFSFIFYFTLNRQARQEFSRLMHCVCPCVISVHSMKRTHMFPKPTHIRLRALPYQIRNQTNFIPKNHGLSPLSNQNGRMLSTQIKNPSLMLSPSPFRIENPVYIKDTSRSLSRSTRPATKGVLLNYGIQVQCCR